MRLNANHPRYINFIQVMLWQIQDRRGNSTTTAKTLFFSTDTLALVTNFRYLLNTRKSAYSSGILTALTVPFHGAVAPTDNACVTPAFAVLGPSDNIYQSYKHPEVKEGEENEHVIVC